MRLLPAVTLAGVLSIVGMSGAVVADEPLSTCSDAVGTFLTTNINPTSGREVGRSLISLTDGGHLFLSDSNQAGGEGFAPFTGGSGAWRCASDEAGRLHILATALDITHETADFPEQEIVRLDYDATYDKTSGTLSADVKLYFMPLDQNPLDAANLKDPVPNQITGIRVTPP